MSRAEMLATYINEHSDAPFSWAEWNCCHFVAGWVLLLTGHYVMNGLPATESLTAAHRLIRQLGGTLRAVWCTWLDRQPVDPALAEVGDVVLLPTGQSTAVGICCGRTAAALTESGIGFVPMASALGAWRIR